MRAPKSDKRKPATPLATPEVLYDATVEPDIVVVPSRRVLAIDGEGAPASDNFARALGALYGVAYTLKFARKRSGGNDFKVGMLEGRWSATGTTPRGQIPPQDEWVWRLRIGVPNDVTTREVAAAIAAAAAKKAGPDARRVFLESVPRQRVGRALHLGPYKDEPRTFDAIDDVLDRAKLEPARSHLEVYLSDPRRTQPAKLKTVLLRELERAA